MVRNNRRVKRPESQSGVRCTLRTIKPRCDFSGRVMVGGWWGPAGQGGKKTGNKKSKSAYKNLKPKQNK